MVRARCLVPRRRIARRRDRHVQPRAVSVRVPARPCRASRPSVGRLPHRSVTRCRPGRVDAARRAPTRPTGDRGGCRRRDDGNAHRLRDRAVLQRRHRVGRRLPHLARNVRPRRGQRTRARRPRVRRARHRARTRGPRARPVRPVRRRGQRNGPDPVDRAAGGGGDDHVRARDLHRLRRTHPAIAAVGDRRTAQPTRDAAARPVSRVPVEQPATRRHHRVRVPAPARRCSPTHAGSADRE